jgi:protein TonB
MKASLLRQNSIAAIVLDAACSGTLPRPASKRPTPLAAGTTPAIVLGVRPQRSAALLALACAAAVSLHAGLVAALASQRRDVAAPASAKPKPILRLAPVVELAPPQAEPVPPPPVSLPRAVRVASRPRAAPSRGPSAAAGQALAASENPAAGLDATDFDLTVGKGKQYGGGVTAAAEISSRPARAVARARHATGDGLDGNGASHAHPVGLPAHDWRCPWPDEAEAAAFDEQTAVIRVSVEADGRVTRTELVSDPGLGFGRVAQECARRQRFSAATDAHGRPVPARSPPIRVKFTR